MCSLILSAHVVRYDARVKAMEVDERPTEEYADIGGLDKQIQELVEAVVLPITHKVRIISLQACCAVAHHTCRSASRLSALSRRRAA